MLARILSPALLGIEALLVEIEVDSKESEKPSSIIVGLPDMAVRESKDRVFTALENSGFLLKPAHFTINLAPGDLKKEGALYDLPIALGMLRSLELLREESHQNYLLVGELSLNGELRPLKGALAMALLAKKRGLKGIFLPQANAKEASFIPGIEVYGVQTLKELFDHLAGKKRILPEKGELSEEALYSAPLIDFADVKGQASAKRALEIAAAGGHNVLLSGPPGAGKSMMAKALLGIMPQMSLEEALESTRIHSIAGNTSEGSSLLFQRPFRAPHHTISYAGLVGGGARPRPGEISLAHNGILFLDELPEFSRKTLEVLRQPLESKEVTISRAQGQLNFPANFVCVAAMNPCPCGFLTHPDKNCTDSRLQVERYLAKISGPLLDRIDLQIEVMPVRYEQLSSEKKEESSELIRKRVERAREIQKKRLGLDRTNSLISSKELRLFCQVDSESKKLLEQAVDVAGLSVRAHDRLLRVARTLADLEACDSIQQHHLMEALSFRQGFESASL